MPLLPATPTDLSDKGGLKPSEIVPAKPPRFGGADLAKLLRPVPKPDEDYLALIEEVVKKQPTVEESGWQR